MPARLLRRPGRDVHLSGLLLPVVRPSAGCADRPAAGPHNTGHKHARRSGSGRGPVMAPLADRVMTMLNTTPTTIAECDERLARVRQARRECGRTETALICSYDDMIDELEAARAALLPEQREP